MCSGEMKTSLDFLWGLLLLIVIVGSLLPAQSTALETLSKLPISDKTEHFAAYAALAFLPSLHRRGLSLAVFMIGTFGLGVALEFGQLYSPGRSFDLWDMGADGAGIVAGLCLAFVTRNLPIGRTSP